MDLSEEDRGVHRDRSCESRQKRRQSCRGIESNKEQQKFGDNFVSSGHFCTHFRAKLFSFKRIHRAAVIGCARQLKLSKSRAEYPKPQKISDMQTILLNLRLTIVIPTFTLL